MSIKDDFANYIDGCGLNAPNTGTWVPGQSGSGNGVMYTSEMYIMMSKNGQLTDQDKIDYANKIQQCIGSGLLSRAPVGINGEIESVDDYQGVCNGCIELGNTSIPRQFLWACISHLGFMNNLNPSSWTAQSFLIRQPQLLCAIVNAAFPSLKNPLHWLVRLAFAPFYLAAAISIGVSCIGAPTTDTDSRRLSWHLLNNTSKTSLMCWLASKIWMKRLNDDYANQMKSVAAIYYQPNGLNQNPYSKWWIT